MRLPVVIIVFLFILPILIDLFISFDIRQMWKKKGLWVYWLTALLCYALLIVAISLPRRDAGSGISAVMWLLFTYITIYTAKVIYLIWSFMGRIARKLLRIKWKQYPSRWIGLGMGVVFMAIMWIGVGHTRHQIMVNEEEVYSPKLPESFDGYRIAQISDLHVGTWGQDTVFVSKLVDSVNALNPDLIVFTGDVVNREAHEIEPFTYVLSRLNAKDGVYSILGNHDYGDYVDWPTPEDKEENLNRLKEHQQNMGWIMLNNESRYHSNGTDSILLIGVENWGEPPFPQYGDLKAALPEEMLNDSTYKLLLSHNPEHWNREVSKETNIDLTLSGHTHAMQAMVKIGDWKWSPSQFKYEQWGGLYHRENDNGEPTAIYVNIGAGEVGLPARLMSAYPEITLITLRKGNVPVNEE